MFFTFQKSQMVQPEEALPGRVKPILPSELHSVFKRALNDPLKNGEATLMFGMGCFWGAERKLWQQPGVTNTAVGYAGGFTPNPSYEEVCSGLTGHTEVVLVVYEPNSVSLKTLLGLFWENHDPTQGMRQGNDIGTQYRSAIYLKDAKDLEIARETMNIYRRELHANAFGEITTEVRSVEQFYFAEDYHQQYLAKNPNGYCGLRGTGISCEL